MYIKAANRNLIHELSPQSVQLFSLQLELHLFKSYHRQCKSILQLYKLFAFMYFSQERAAYEPFINLMEDPSLDSWVKGKSIIQKMLVESATLPAAFVNEIRRNIRKVSSLLMFVYLFSLNPDNGYGLLLDEKQYNDILKKKNCYFQTYNWIITQSKEISQAAIELILEFLPQFFIKKGFTVSLNELKFLLYIFNNFEIKRERDITTLMTFTSNLQDLRISGSSFETKEMMIIIFICQILADGRTAGNMGILFDEALIGGLNDRNIDRYCTLYECFICELSAEKLFNIMNSLCKAGLNFLIAVLIYKITRVLISEEEFYKLKYLLETFILPILIKNGKCCARERVEEVVLKIGECYIIGFLAYCDIGDTGISLLLYNVQHVSNEAFRLKWIELAYMAAQKSNLEKKVDDALERLNLGKYVALAKKGKDHFNDIMPWEITARNIREHKVYNRQESDLSGIINKSSQCYIISTVQALFMSKNLYELLQKVPKRSFKITQALSIIFGALSGEKSKDIKIDNVQDSGPKMFAHSLHQQDVYEYLIALMDQLENEFKEEKLLKEFKQIFEIEWKATVRCNKCKAKTTSIQNTYIHTISNNEKFRLESEEELTDFNCQKCKSNSCTKSLRVHLTSKIFIIHINRFSVEKGVPKKELPTEKIPRRIENYSLIGIIFHIGKNVECGHYVYYSKIGGKRWAEFNDTIVKQFDLSTENEEFEREMKAEKTPYILFYKRQD